MPVHKEFACGPEEDWPMHYDRDTKLVDNVVFKGRKYLTSKDYRQGALASYQGKSIRSNPYGRDKQGFYGWKQGYLNQASWMRDQKKREKEVKVPNAGW
jgi:hypothetical protein